MFDGYTIMLIYDAIIIRLHIFINVATKKLRDFATT